MVHFFVKGGKNFTYNPSLRITAGNVAADGGPGTFADAGYDQILFTTASVTPTGVNYGGDWLNWGVKWSVASVPTSATFDISVKITNNLLGSQTATVYLVATTGAWGGISPAATYSFTVVVGASSTVTGTGSYVLNSPAAVTSYCWYAKVTTGTLLTLNSANADTWVKITY